MASLDFVFHLSWASVWFWALCLIALVWLRRHLQLNQAHLEPILSVHDAVGTPDTLPSLSVLVAGKDEEPNIGRCLSGLLAQRYPRLEVVAADDRSTDRTGAIIDDLAARDARLKTVHVRELTPGWTGKNHAMYHAVEHATGEYLCFTDADCQFHDPELLAAAVRFAQRENVDLLSVLPELEAHTFWERVVQPPAGAIMVFWFPPAKVNNPRSPRAYANGAFMLMSRRVYDTLGGHAHIRDRLNEDMRFAQRAKTLGLRLRVIRGGGMYTVRMYAGLRQIWHGWSRIFYCCFQTVPRIVLSILFLAVFSISPYVSLFVSPLLGRAGAGVALAAAVAAVAQQTVLWRFYALGSTPRHWALTYPLGAAVCLATMFSSLTRHAGAQTNWRGTAYRGGA